MVRKFLVIALLLALLSACAPAPVATPSPEACASARGHLEEALVNANADKAFYEQMVALRESAIFLVSATFTFNDNDLRKPMPKAPIVLIPPDLGFVDCSSTAIDTNLALAQSALNAGKSYLDAADVEIAIQGTLLELAERNSLSLADYNKAIEDAIAAAQAAP